MARTISRTWQRLNGTLATGDGLGLCTVDPSYEDAISWRFGHERTIVTVHYDRHFRPRRFFLVMRDGEWNDGGMDS